MTTREASMRDAVVGMLLMLAAGWAGEADAREKPLEELPQDVWTLAFAWAEPIKQAIREARRFDPVSGVWFGLLEGSVKSFERAAAVFFPPPQEAPKERRGQPLEEPLLRYTF